MMRPYQGEARTVKSARQLGFTLIEMALVVAILGLLVGGSAFAITPIIRQAKITATNGSMDQLEAALVLFAIRNDRLPCPADGSLTSASANYGIEPTTKPTGTGTCTVALANSVVPWKTLGMDETYSLDGWGNRIAYFPANGTVTGVDTLVDGDTTGTCAAGSSCTLCLSRTTGTSSTRIALCDPSGATASLTPSYPYGNYIAIYSTTSLTTELTSTQPAAATITSTTAAAGAGLRAAYVLISHGQSGWYAWTKAGTQVQPYSTTPYTLKKINSGILGNMTGSAGNLGFVQGNSQNLNNFASATYFDDIVRWRSPGFIIENCGSSSCGNP